MTHFLQRLAISVIRPASESRLRPLQGSVFAPTRNSFADEAASSFESNNLNSGAEGEARAAAEIRTPGGREISKESLVTSPSAFTESLAEIPKVSRLAEVSPPQDPSPLEAPLFAEHTQLPPLSSPGARSSSLRDSAQGREDRGVKPSLTKDELEHREALPAQVRFATAMGQSDPKLAVQLLPPQPAAAPPKISSVNAARTPAPPPRKPDEIHIHIGRIEVAAVSQPAARPAPAQPTRKSINLDEYLRRGNGRAG